jgi:ELWxxDGT repeat protein
MKKHYLFVLSFVLAFQIANSQISLLKDINNFSSASGGSPNSMTQLGSYLYFNANDGVNGAELWRTDGTTTTFFKDIQPGDLSGNPNSFVLMGSALYFIADDGDNGPELWRTDGTVSGTYMLLDINPTPATGSSISQMTNCNGVLYFRANDGTNGSELWKSDGTSAGTVMIQDINTTSAGASSSPSEFTWVSGTTVYFAAADANGAELWKTDGTSITTSKIKDINPGAGAGSFPSELTKLGSNVVFSANDGTNGTELWITNGTLAGTNMVSNINPVGASSSPSAFTVVGTWIYFAANNGTVGSELWRTDGTALNTNMLTGGDLNPLANGSFPFEFTLIGTTLYFVASSDTENQLYRVTNATGAPGIPSLITNLGSFFTNHLVNVNGTLYFYATTGAGRELTSYNGVTLTTIDILTGPSSGIPTSSGTPVLISPTTILFAADNGSGIELWKTTQGLTTASLVKDFRSGTAASFPSKAVYTGTANKMYFTADDGSNGFELFVTDGNPLTPSTTALVKNINPGAVSSNPSNLTMVGSTLFFTANDGTNGIELWKSDGTLGGTVLININLTAGASSNPFGLTALNATTLIFSANDGVNGNEVYKIDVGSVIPTIIGNNNFTSQPFTFKLMGSEVFFGANNGTGVELWKTNGTTTTLVKDINVTTGTASSSPNSFAVVGSTLYFQASDGVTGFELWKTDGTTVNTTIVSDINTTSANASSGPVNITALGSNIYFSATNGTNGFELWKSDGTNAGTVLVKDIFSSPTSTSSSPQNLTVFNGKIYFSARDASNGIELWVTDGTSTGTTLFKDINPGNLHSSPSFFNVSGSSLYFIASDGTGNNIFVTDGVRSCATLMVPQFGGAATAGASNLIVGGSKLYFTMIAQGYETEPFVLDPTAVSSIANTAINTHPVTQTITTGSAVTFSVAAVGTNLTYQWQKNSVDIGGATSPSYNIPSTAATDAGQYRCAVTGTCGTINSNQATLTVLASKPIAQPAALIFSSLANSSMTVSFTPATGSPAGYLVLRNATATPTEIPVDGSTYTAATSFGTSTIVSSGPSISFGDAGLASNTIYYYAIYSFNGAGVTSNYLATSPLTGSRTTLNAEPTAQPTAMAFSSITNTGFTVSFTAATGTPSGYLAIRKSGSSPSGVPVDGTVYTSGTTLGDGTIAFAGAATTFNESLNANALFYDIYSYNGSGAAINYFTSTVPLEGSYLDATAPVITNETAATLASGNSLDIIASVVENESQISSVSLEYKSVASSAVAKTQPLVLSAGKWKYTIPANEIGELGVEYKITATNSSSLNSNVSGKTTLTFTDQTVSFNSFGSTQLNFRIISVPLDLTSKSVNDVFADDLGAYNKASWRMFRYEGGSTKELTGTSTIDLGKGYWLIVKDNKTIDTGPGKTATTSSTEPFVINLVSGWNQIGNPYPFNVLWSDVLSASGISSKLRTYGASGFVDDTKLSTDEGGFVFSNGAATLKFPVAKNPAAGRVQETVVSRNLNSIDQSDWEVNFSLRNGDISNQFGGIGMSGDASMEYDQYDDFTLPRFQDYLEVNHNKSFFKNFYTKDVIPSTENHIWEFSVESNLGGITEMGWDNSYFGNNSKNISLFDIEANATIDMKQSNSYSFESTASRKFKVVYGSEAFVKDNALPQGLVINNVYPNPTESSVTIGITVPNHSANDQTVVSINNVLGKLITNVYEGTLTPGYHELKWSGIDALGQRPTQGLYLVEVKTGPSVKVKRLVIK